MATFVHNEPTSLPIIQEAGLPQAFYKAIEAGLEPVIEVNPFDLQCCHLLIHKYEGNPSYSQCNRSPVSQSSRARSTRRSPKHHSGYLHDLYIRTSLEGAAG